MLELSSTVCIFAPLDLLVYNPFRSCQKTISITPDKPPHHRFCFASDEILDWLAGHGPYIEASAGSGWFSWQMQIKGVESSPFDIMSRSEGEGYTIVEDGENGTFEDKYPNHTLIIIHGFCGDASVEKYTGNKVVIGGYKLLDKIIGEKGEVKYRIPDTGRLSKIAHLTRPSLDYMISHGWTLIETRYCETPNYSTADHAYMMYVRNI